MDTITISCDGGSSSLGHPRVFLRLKDTGITCPYCSKKYDAAGQEVMQTLSSKKQAKSKRAPSKKTKSLKSA